jgi:hypothetical protein
MDEVLMEQWIMVLSRKRRLVCHVGQKSHKCNSKFGDLDQRASMLVPPVTVYATPFTLYSMD